MNFFKNLSSAVRKLSILLVIIALVSFFLFLYYYRYIPDNRDRLQRQAFLILKQNEQGFKQSNTDLVNYFKSKKLYLTDSVSVTGKPDSTQFYEPFRFTRRITRPGTIDSGFKATDSTTVIPEFDYKSGTICFKIRGKKYDVSYCVGLDHIYRNILENGRKDFFESYFIIDSWNEPKSGSVKESAQKKKGKSESSEKEVEGTDKKDPENQDIAHIVYHSPSISIADQLPSDSISNLISRVEFPKIVSIEIGNRSYKAFLQPFQFRDRNKNTLILVGLMSNNEYNDRLQNIPFDPVSLIIMLSLLVFISMPYLKVFFISPEERFGIRDMASLGVTMTIGSAFLLIMLQYLVMRTGSAYRTEQEIRGLSEKVNKEFKSEIHMCCQTLNQWDNLLNKEWHVDTTPNRLNDFKVFRVKGRDGFHMIWKPKAFNDAYRNYTVVHWANDSGNQVFKVSFVEKAFPLLSVAHRQYFKDIIESRLYNSYFDSSRIDSFAIQPTYSMSSSAFEANISKPSHLNDSSARMIALSAQLFSVINTIFPPGYGFYIIDQTGIIQFQSEGAVTLKENFLEWINQKENLAYLLKSRQNRYISEQIINNRSYSAYISPLANLPYSLIVYHCNDDNTASILHISALSVFFTLVYFPFLFLICYVAWKNTSFFSFLYQPVFQYKWLRPGKDKTNFFAASILFLFLYIILTVLFLFHYSHCSTIWYIGFFFPINALWTIYLLFRLFYLSKLPQAGIKKRILRSAGSLVRFYNIVPLVTLMVLSVVFRRIEDNWEARLGMIGFVCISLALIPVMTLLIPYLFHTIRERWQPGVLLKDHPLILYAFFWTMNVMAIGIIPVHCFYQYAQQKEISMVIRGRQLMQSQAIESRLMNYKWLENVSKQWPVDDSDRNKILFSRGIYSLNASESLLPLDSFEKRMAGVPMQNTDTYEKVLRGLSWNYHSLDKNLTIEHEAGDRKWVWREEMDDSNRWAILDYKIAPEIVKDQKLTKVNSLTYRTVIPSILTFYGLDMWRGIGAVVLVSIALLSSFFTLFRNITYRIFLLGFKPNFSGRTIKSQNHLLKKWPDKNYLFKMALNSPYDQCEPKPADPLSETENLWRAEYICRRNDEECIRRLEDRILGNQQRFEKLYEYLWQECSEREKYLLYNISRDGFTNYKNSTLIHRMVDKGFLIIDENSGLNMMSVSFRNFILDKANTEEIINLTNKIHVQGGWNNIRTPVLIAITVFGTFLFITQEDLIQRVAAIVPTIGAIFGLGAMIFGSKSQQSTAK